MYWTATDGMGSIWDWLKGLLAYKVVSICCTFDNRSLFNGKENG